MKSEPLVLAVQEQFALLAADHPRLQREMAKLRLSPMPASVFCGIFPGGVRPVLNSDHPFIVQLRRQENPSPEHLGMLCSALFSVMNRAAERLTDLHEREFHARLLATLV